MKKITGILTLFTLLVTNSTLTLACRSGGTCGGGGNSRAGQMFPQFSYRLAGPAEVRLVPGANEIASILTELRKHVPDYARELQTSAVGLTFFLMPEEYSNLPSSLTGIPVSSDQDALHTRNSEVFVSAANFNARNAVARRNFLMQELLEEHLLQKFPSMAPERMHHIARTLTQLILAANGRVSPESLQQELVRLGVGHYLTAGQESARSAGARNAPVELRAENVIVLVNNVPIRSFDRDSRLRVGDVVQIRVNATDPNNRPLQYNFVTPGQTDGDDLERRWSSNNTLTYTVQEEDALSNLHINYGVRNTSEPGAGIWNNILGGVFVRTDAIDSPATLEGFVVRVNGLVLPSRFRRILNPGDRIEAEINSNASQQAPVEYSLELSRGNASTIIFSNRTRLSYVITESDIGEELGITAHIRYQQSRRSWGDQSSYVDLGIVAADRQGPNSGSLIGTARTWVNDQEVTIRSGQPLIVQVGDRIRMAFSAESPSGRPVQYRHISPITGDFTDWTSNNTLEYVVGPEHRLQYFLSTVSARDNPNWNGRSSSIQGMPTIFVGTSEVTSLPLVLGATATQPQVRPLNRAEARSVLLLLEAQSDNACAPVRRSLQTFLNDSSRSEIEVLGFVTPGNAAAAANCGNMIREALQAILQERSGDAQKVNPGAANPDPAGVDRQMRRH